MAENTKIEWCDHTVNLWHGCAKVHPGCKNAGVPYFFKQIDKVRPIPPDLLIREKPF